MLVKTTDPAWFGRLCVPYPEEIRRSAFPHDGGELAPETLVPPPVSEARGRTDAVDAEDEALAVATTEVAGVALRVLLLSAEDVVPAWPEHAAALTSAAERTEAAARRRARECGMCFWDMIEDPDLRE
jgi:hypothetical protein